MEEQTARALEATYTAAIAASCASASLSIKLAWSLARKGLITPDEVDDLAHGISAPFADMSDNPFAEQALAAFQAHLDPEFAWLREVARQAQQGNPP